MDQALTPLQKPKRRAAKPRLGPALRLRCPYCGVTPLRAEAAWFTFRRGCEGCDYRYEREIGYYTGASWMINFPVIGLFAFVLAGLLLWLAPALGTMTIVGVASFSMLALGIFITPYCMALWLFLEHYFRPLGDDEAFDKEHLG